jgi:Na+/H+-dicarboxylate symporter
VGPAADSESSGFSFNLRDSAVYLTMASMFLTQVVDIHLSWQQQLIMSAS